MKRKNKISYQKKENNEVNKIKIYTIVDINNQKENNTISNNNSETENKAILFFAICIAAVLMIFLIPKSIIYEYGNLTITGLIIIYYINIIKEEYILNKGKILESIKSIFFNFLGLVTLYNIFLAFNPINMIELEHNIISNILYFYISFLIMTSEYNFYNKIKYLIDVFFGSITVIKKHPYLSTFGISNFFFLLVIFVINFTIDSDSLFFVIKTISYSIIAVMIGSVYILGLNEKDIQELKNKNYRQFKSFISDFENLMNILNNWFLELFKIEKIKEIQLLDENGKIKFINVSIFVLLKIVILYFLITMYMNNTYYLQYSFESNGYCKGVYNHEIIKMKNNNVLIFGKVNKESHNYYLFEVKCEKELKKIEIIERKLEK